MAQNYEDILRAFYDEFGDELIAFGKEAVIEGLKKSNPSAKTAHDKCSPTDKKTKKDTLEDSVAAAKAPESVADEEPDYYNAEVFERQTLGSIQAGAVAVLNSEDVARAISDLITMAGEVRKFEEAQITVRADIASQRDIALANIEVKKAALMTYLDKSFDERKENFQKFFSVVDDALEKDNMQELVMGLESIIKLADSSPFKDLESIEATASALTDPDHE